MPDRLFNRITSPFTVPHTGYSNRLPGITRWVPALFSGFVVPAIILLSVQADRASARPQQDGQTTPPVLLISVDGLMPAYIARNDTPNFDTMIAGGVSADLEPVFPTKTFPTHYSMVTGLYVENHGIITNRFYDHDLNLMFSYGPPPYGPPDSVWWGGEPVWVTAEKQGKTSATMYWPASDSEIKGVRPSRYKEYSNLLSPEARIDTVVSWLDPSGPVRADFATLYFSEVDSRGHSFGPGSVEIDEAVRHMDRLMGRLLRRLEQAGLAGEINIIVVSDHGMAELSEEKVIFLDELINLDRVDIIDRTPVAMLRPEPGFPDSVYRKLKENEEGYNVYLKEDLPTVYRFQAHRRIPEIIMIADVSYTITTRAIFEQNGIPKGGHGYDHRSEEMQALFIAAGPSFPSGMETGTVKSIHLYELICHLLGITPAPNDGSLTMIRHILLSQ